MLALTRAVSPSIQECELTHLDREPIDLEAATRQHATYERALASLGCSILAAPPAPELPDAVFVEDTAVVVDEIAIMSRPGATNRRSELGPVADLLSRYRTLRWIEAPGTLDGGDVLRIGRTVLVGLSARTNRAGAEQLRRILEPLGYRVETLAVVGCLHLKTAVTAASEEALLVNPEWVNPAALGGYNVLEIDPREPYAANVLPVGGTVLMPAGQPRTRDRLDAAGFGVLEVEVSELAKAEAGVTCCSIVLTEEM